jgi:hypothetical protein
MTLRYFFRRTGRSQKGPGGPASASGPDWPPRDGPNCPPPDWLGPAGGEPDGPDRLAGPLSLDRSGGAAFREGPRDVPAPPEPERPEPELPVPELPVPELPEPERREGLPQNPEPP